MRSAPFRRLALAATLLAGLTACAQTPVGPRAGLRVAQGLTVRADNGWGIDDPFIVDTEPPTAPEVRIVRVGRQANHWYPSGHTYASERWRLILGEDQVDVLFPADPALLKRPAAQLLDRLAAYYAMIPPANRAALHLVQLDAHEAADDAENRIKYGWPPDVGSAAQSGLGEMTWFRGAAWLNREGFQHEFGHLVAGTLETGCYYTPPGWPAARDGDATSLGQYADSDDAEDFATAYRAFLEAERTGGALRARFKQQFPRRAALLAKIVVGQALPPAACGRPEAPKPALEALAPARRTR